MEQESRRTQSHTAPCRTFHRLKPGLIAQTAYGVPASAGEAMELIMRYTNRTPHPAERHTG